MSMAGFLAAETLCDADVSESVVAREMHAAEHKQQQHAFNHHQSQGMSNTQHMCGGYLVLPCTCSVLLQCFDTVGWASRRASGLTN